MANPVVPELKQFMVEHEDEIARGVFKLRAAFKHLLGREPVKKPEVVMMPLEG